MSKVIYISDFLISIGENKCYRIFQNSMQLRHLDI